MTDILILLLDEIHIALSNLLYKINDKDINTLFKFISFDDGDLLPEFSRNTFPDCDY